MIAALYVQADGCYAGLPHWGGPTIARLGRKHLVKGDDGGCFAAALAAVRRWGGVLEHPASSHAWLAHGLPWPPSSGGWHRDIEGGWCCHVEQGWYGNPARKATWLYAVGTDLPSLRWGPAVDDFRLIDVHGKTTEERRRIVRNGVCQQLSKRKRAATPPEFRDLLISIARTA